MTELPNYDQLFDAIDAALAQRQAEGLPLNISIWDGNHSRAEPLRVLADVRLAEIASTYGTPVRIDEEAAATRLNTFIESYISASLEERQDMQTRFSRLGAERAQAYISLLEQAAGNMPNESLGLTEVPLFYPDPRGEAMAEVQQLSGARFYPVFMGEMQRVDSSCILLVTERLFNSLSPEDQEDYIEFFSAFSSAAVDAGGGVDTTLIDDEIGQRVHSYYEDVEDPIFITKYGLAHFSKQADLDESFEGVSVAFIDSPGALSFHYQNELHSDVPDMVYYMNSQQMVLLDSEESIHAFMYGDAMPERGNQNGIILSDDVRAECEAALAHLVPYVEAGEEVTEPDVPLQLIQHQNPNDGRVR